MPLENQTPLENRTKDYHWNTEHVWLLQPLLEVFIDFFCSHFTFRTSIESLFLTRLLYSIARKGHKIGQWRLLYCTCNQFSFPVSEVQPTCPCVGPSLRRDVSQEPVTDLDHQALGRHFGSIHSVELCAPKETHFR